MKIKKIKQVQPPRAPVIPRETIEIAERCEMLVTGVLGIDEYSQQSIRVKTKQGLIQVTGRGLIM